MAIELSICIVNWNAPRELLRQCLASIRQADTTDFSLETIVVDNASSDGSAEMVAGEFPEVTLVRNAANAGFARGNNQAAAVSRGQYLFFLNNDTVVPRGSLEAILAFMQSHPEVGMVGPRLIGADGRPQYSYRGRLTFAALMHRQPLFRLTRLFRKVYCRYRFWGFNPNVLCRVDSLMGAAVCLPRDVFFAHHGWDEQFQFGLEDVDLSDRVAQTHPIMFFPGAEIVHVGGVSSRANSAFACLGEECGYVRYLRKQGLRAWKIAAYKLLVLLNLPAALLLQAFRAVSRRLRRGPAPPGRPHSQLAPLWYFSTRGLARFLRL